MAIYEPRCGKIHMLDFDHPCSFYLGHSGDCDNKDKAVVSKNVKIKSDYFISLGWSKTVKPSESDQEARINALLEEGLDE